jgi:hypothetical protein
MTQKYWIVEAWYIPLTRKCVYVRLTTVLAEGKPPFATLAIAGRTVYREGFARKSRAMKRIDHIYAKNPQLD